MGELDTNVPPVIPRRQAYQAGLQLSHVFNRRDTLSISSSGSYTITEPSAESQGAAMSTNWSHILSRNTSMSLFGAVNYAHSIDLLGNNVSVVLPGAGGTLAINTAVQPRPSHLTVFFSGSMAPRVDYQYGGISNSVSGAGGIAWTRERWSLQITGNFWHLIASYGATSAVTTYGASESFVYALDRWRHWTVTGGTRQAMQSYSNGQPLPLTWVSFIGISYTTGPMIL